MKLSRREMVEAGLSAFTLTCVASTSVAAKSPGRGVRRTSIKPGELWTDTAGKPIQAHGGGAIHVDGVFYWYGENKEFTTGKDTPESWGIRIYRSTDLYNWDDAGLLIPPDRSGAKTALSPSVFPERPHILHNRKTGKFVCWIKVRGLGPEHRIVLTADKITGPYTMVNEHLLPAGMKAGDFDMVADHETGRAYMYFEHDHKELVCIELTEDWCGVTNQLSRHFPSSAPDTKEGIACFQRGGKLYLTASAMTGYFPNPSSVVVAKDCHGPFEELGDLHPGDRSRTSFNSQISCIFKHPRKKDLYIAMADRWFPQLGELGGEEFNNGNISENLRSAIRKISSKPSPPPTPAEVKALQFFVKSGGSALTGVNTSISRYVWLPVHFLEDRPTIEWSDEWRVNDYS